MRSLIVPLTLTLAPACATEDDYVAYYATLDGDGDGATLVIDCEPDNDEVYDHEWYEDLDGDGHGDPDTRVDTCDAPETGGPWVSTGDDCNDADPDVHQTSTGYRDGDQDGFGASMLMVTLCDDGETLAARTGDCDEGDPDVNPAMEPVCGNGKDDDCDGVSDCDPADGELDSAGADAQYQGEGEEALGASLAAADIDGDGFDDVIVGAPDDMGSAYVVAGPFSGELDVDEEASVRLTGLEGSAAGSALSGLGDIDGDGYDDVLVGAPGGDDAMAVLVYGPVRAVEDAGDEPELSTVSRDMVELGLTVTGGYEVGAALAAPGDLLGADGEADVVVTAPGSSSVYVVRGPMTTDVSLNLDSDVARIDGASSLDLGTSVATIQDLDGDGRAELAVGAPGYTDSFMGGFHPAAGKGAVYIYFEAGNLDVEDADCVILGEESAGRLGDALADAGDIDGDGLGDLLIGAPKVEDEAGAAWLFTGEVLRERAAPELDDREAYFYGADSEELAGQFMLGRVDLDQDGNQDLLIGSPKASWGGGENAGGVGIWYGPLSGRHNTENADAVVLGEDQGLGAPSLFGWSMVATQTNDLIIGAPGVGAEVADEGGDVRFGDGVTYVFHLGW